MERMQTRRRQRRSTDEIASILDEFDRSRLTQTEFAVERNLSVSTLRWWLRNRRGGNQSQEKRRPGRFVPVKLSDMNLVAEPTLEIVLGTGCSVRVPASFDPGALAALLPAIERAC